MPVTLIPNSAVDAASLTLVPAPLDPREIAGGSPEAAASDVLDTPALTVGVWELTEGTVTDTEVDEVFVVLSGRATVAFEGVGDDLDLYPGVIGRLAAGSRTRWTVTETLRKVYICAPSSNNGTSE